MIIYLLSCIYNDVRIVFDCQPFIESDVAAQLNVNNSEWWSFRINNEPGTESVLFLCTNEKRNVDAEYFCVRLAEHTNRETNWLNTPWYILGAFLLRQKCWAFAQFIRNVKFRYVADDTKHNDISIATVICVLIWLHTSTHCSTFDIAPNNSQTYLNTKFSSAAQDAKLILISISMANKSSKLPHRTWFKWYCIFIFDKISWCQCGQFQANFS